MNDCHLYTEVDLWKEMEENMSSEYSYEKKASEI